MARQIPVEVAAPVTVAGFTTEHRYLPEGIQMVTLWGKRYIGGVLIQYGANSTNGGLFFFDPSNGQVNIVDLESRPGTFRPVEGQEGKFLVIMGNQVGVVTLNPDWTSSFASILEVPRNFADGQVITANDGCVINPRDPAAPSRIIAGFKDTKFRTDRGHGCLLEIVGTKLNGITANAICPNGNAFIASGKKKAKLLHIETGRQTVQVMDYDPDRGVAGHLIDCFSFKTELFTGEHYHDSMYPDGMVNWTTPAGRQKAIIAIFDPRESSKEGLAFQFDLTGPIFAECVYILPGSPRVTCPALVEIDGRVEVWFSTASEGLLDKLGIDDLRIGSLFRAPGTQTSLTSAPKLDHYRL